MDGKWRVVIEGDGGFCRGGVQTEYDANEIAYSAVQAFLALKQTVNSAQFTSDPPLDVFSRDLLHSA